MADPGPARRGALEETLGLSLPCRDIFLPGRLRRLKRAGEALRYRFGSFELSPARLELAREGQAQPVEPQVFDLLHLMVRRAGELVTHDELIEEVWAGRIVSDSAISARISAARAALGDDGVRQAYIRTVPRRGFRFVAPVEVVSDDAASPAAGSPGPLRNQRVRFCTSGDGTRIAYAVSGSGRPLVRAGHWLTHLEHDWQSPVWRPMLDALGQRFEVTRYDQRGNGLSDWTLRDVSLDRFVEDLELVVDAAGLDRFVLMGSSQGAPIAIAYAARHPERVSRLVLHGGYHKGRLLRSTAAERDQGEAMLTLIRHGWGRPGSPFIKAFASMFLPDADREQVESLAELQKITTSPENAVRLRQAVDEFDVTDLLGTITVPTLVLHARDDGVQPLDQGRELAAGIPGAEFVMLEGANHVILPHERAWPALFQAIDRFVDGAA